MNSLSKNSRVPDHLLLRSAAGRLLAWGVSHFSFGLQKKGWFKHRYRRPRCAMQLWCLAGFYPPLCVEEWCNLLTLENNSIRAQFSVQILWCVAWNKSINQGLWLWSFAQKTDFASLFEIGVKRGIGRSIPQICNKKTDWRFLFTIHHVWKTLKKVSFYNIASEASFILKELTQQKGVNFKSQ